MLFALQAQGIKVVDGQQLMHEVRKIKTQDEITLLNTATMMVDAAYDELYRFMKPGVKENECVGVVSKVLYDLGSEHVEGVNAISGERCSPHPHVYTDRVLRPGDPAFFDILHSFNGYRTCYYRTFAIGSASPAMVDAYKRSRDYMDAAISIVKPGITTADVVKLWPKAQEFGFANEEAAFALQYGHGVGLSIWEKPIFSRLVSLDHPEVIEEGMVFALETYWPASDGWSAARLEEEVVVTKDGCELITRFPSEKLLVAGTHYFTTGGELPTTRETQSNLNNPGALERVKRGRFRNGLKPFECRWPCSRFAVRQRLMPTNVIMLALGVAQQTGTLLKWLKAEGQPVSKGEPLMEIETDKSTVEIEVRVGFWQCGRRFGEDRSTMLRQVRCMRSSCRLARPGRE